MTTLLALVALAALEPSTLESAAEVCALADIHADTSMHGLDLDDERPGLAMRAWRGLMRGVGWAAPAERNFFRHVTRASLDKIGRGLQIFSIVGEGLPPFFGASFNAYERLVAGAPPEAMATPFNALVYQLGWIQRQVARNPARLTFAPTAREAAGYIVSDMVVVQIGLEGARALDPAPGDVEAYEALIRHVDLRVPAPTHDELTTRQGRVRYLKRLGVIYASLNHLGSSRFCGSDLLGSKNRHMGLSPEGEALVALFEREGLLLDAAHASARGQDDIARLVDERVYTWPLIVSHSIYRPQGPRLAWRVTRPSLLRAVKQSGGVAGVMFARAYLPHQSIDDVADEIDYLRAELGIDSIAIGSDADGFIGLVGDGDLADAAGALFRVLETRGYSRDDIKKIRGGNYLRMLERRDRLFEMRGIHW